MQRDIGERVTRDHFDQKIEGLSEKLDKLPKKEHLDARFEALASQMRLEIERALGRRSSAEESDARGTGAG